MRRLAPFALILFAALCLLTSCGRRVLSSEPEPQEVSPTRYEIAATLLTEEKVLSAETAITCACPVDDLAAVKLRLYANAYAEGCELVTEDKVAATYPRGKVNYGGAEILEATVDGMAATYDLGQGGTLLTLRLGRKYAKGETLSLRIATRVTLANCRHRLGYADDYYFLSDFYPVLCPFREGKYLAYPYTPYGDPYPMDAANYELTLTLPRGYECAASSFEIRREIQGTATLLSYALVGARDFALVCSRKLRYAEGSAGDVPLRYYYESDAKKADTLARIEAAVTTFEDMFGAYPYPTYTVVLAPFFEAGVEHSGLSVVSSDLTTATRAETILHETAHQWWFGKVGSDPCRDPWMDEGLAEYSVVLCYHRSGSTAAYRAKLSAAEDAYAIRLALKGVEGARFDLPLSALSEGYYDRVYCGGLLLFASLAGRVGEDRLVAALRRYADSYAGETATPTDLISCLSDALDDDLSAFFSAWLSGKVPVG